MPLPNQIPSNFFYSPQLSALYVAYENDDAIADDVLPIVKVPGPAFYYNTFDKFTRFNIFETKVGRTSATNQIDWSSTQQTASVDDHALEEVVPRRDQELAASAGLPDPKLIAVEHVAESVSLAREQRAANLLFNSNNYSSTNVVALAGQAQWSDFVNSDPGAAITDAAASMLVKPNKLVIGQKPWNKLRRHPKLVQAANANPGQYGLLSETQVADLLELDEVVVGRARWNTQAIGQPGTLDQIWGNYAALIYVSGATPSTNTLTFGMTAQWGENLAFEYVDPKAGMRSSDIVRAGNSLKELIIAKEAGYLFQNPIA